MLFVVAPASGYLSLVRQGDESRGIPNAGDLLGKTVCTGDFDGDGYDDLASAAPDEANGIIGTAAHGSIIINFGTSRGIGSEGASEISVGDLGTEAARFGHSMVSADFNNDGYDDLAVGIPQLNNFGGPDRGAVWIYAGSKNGLELAPYLQISYDEVEVLEEDWANFGWALTSGDFNDDGYPDVATSAIGQDGNTGVLYFFFGSHSGLTTNAFQKMYPYTAGGSQALGSRFGWALAAGQLDGVGGDDLVVGAPATTVMGQNNAGRVYFYYAGVAGITGTGAWFLDASNLGLSATDGDANLGFSLAVGHMYQVSGQVDVAMGAPKDNYNAQNDAGSVILVEFDSLPSNYDSLRKLRQGGIFNATNASTGDQFGYSLAVGRWDIGNHEDLAIGAPYEDVVEQGVLGTQFNSGIFHVVYGQAGGPSMTNSETYTSMNINNFANGGDNLGFSLAFGRFDAGSRHALAVGAPYADFDSYESGGTDVSNAGQVHIIAPWRQPADHPHRSSVAFDCDGYIAYAQRPYQRVRPASTTKALTLLLACEAISNGDINPNQFYLVPQWVSDDVGGSQTPLVEGEQLSFTGLMQTMMTVSGNDSAMLIGAILSGDGGPWDGWEGTSPAFATMLEDKVDQLGLSGLVSMTNAAGIDSGDHYVTALDWATLAYLLIQNDCVKTIVNTSPWNVERIQPEGTSLDFFAIDGGGNGDISVFELFSNNWVGGVKGSYPSAVGMKDGLTPGAWATGISAADPFGDGRSAASSFGSRRKNVPVDGVVAGSSSRLNADLLKLAEGFCDDGEIDDINFNPTPDPDPKPWGILTSIPPCPDAGVRGLTINMAQEQIVIPGRFIQLDLMRRTHYEPQIPVKMMVKRDSEIEIAYDDVVNYGIAPHSTNDGLIISNIGAATATILLSWDGSTVPHTLLPGDQIVIASISTPISSLAWSIKCLSSVGVTLAVHELGYKYDLILGDGLGSPDSHSVQLVRDGNLIAETVTTYVRGFDDVCDSDLLDLVARADSGVPTSVVDDNGLLPAAPASFQLLPNFPNPFNPSTTIRFDLPKPAIADLIIYDVRGRQVKTFASGEHFLAGRHQLHWDGTDDSGAQLASGVYFLRFSSGSQSQAQRMTLIK